MSLSDPIIGTIFSLLRDAQPSSKVADHLFVYLMSSFSQVSVSSFDYLWIKKQFEDLCQDTSNRSLFLSLLTHSKGDSCLELFCAFIDHWEDKHSLYDVFQLFCLGNNQLTQLNDAFVHCSTVLCSYSFVDVSNRNMSFLLS